MKTASKFKPIRFCYDFTMSFWQWCLTRHVFESFIYLGNTILQEKSNRLYIKNCFQVQAHPILLCFYNVIWQWCFDGTFLLIIYLFKKHYSSRKENNFLEEFKCLNNEYCFQAEAHPTLLSCLTRNVSESFISLENTILQEKSNRLHIEFCFQVQAHPILLCFYNVILAMMFWRDISPNHLFI
jgi:hypothetical protein